MYHAAFEIVLHSINAHVQIMEYAPHGNLSAYLNGQVRPLGWREKRRLCIDVARGLEYLHARAPQPLVHGDLKVS